MSKNKATAYGIFMQEYISRRRGEGHNVTMAQAQTLCSDSWKELTDVQKHEYKLKAKGQKGNLEKYTCDGISYKQIDRQEREQQEKQDKLESDIRFMIQNLERGSDLEEKHFYLVHANAFCVTSTGQYVPAEIAVLQFNLYEGERSFYHAIIDPGTIPAGSLSDAKKSVETHKIPLPMINDKPIPGKKETTTVFPQLKKWLKDKSLDAEELILFAMPGNENVCIGVINSLNEAVHYQEELNVRVACADRLFFELKTLCVLGSSHPQENFAFRSTATNELKRDPFYFTPNIGCQYHDLDQDCENNYQYCSLSWVHRMLYQICDHCCHHLDVSLVPNKHCPERALTVRNTPASASVYSESEPPSRASAYPDSAVTSDGEDDSWQTARPRGARGRGGFRS